MPPLSFPIVYGTEKSFRELSFKKGDIIYIRRQIDKNWYEGEHNATIGLLPVQYVDVRIQLHCGYKSSIVANSQYFLFLFNKTIDNC